MPTSSSPHFLNSGLDFTQLEEASESLCIQTLEDEKSVHQILSLSRETVSHLRLMYGTLMGSLYVPSPMFYFHDRARELRSHDYIHIRDSRGTCSAAFTFLLHSARVSSTGYEPRLGSIFDLCEDYARANVAYALLEDLAFVEMANSRPANPFRTPAPIFDPWQNQWGDSPLTPLPEEYQTSPPSPIPETVDDDEQQQPPPPVRNILRPGGRYINRFPQPRGPQPGVAGFGRAIGGGARAPPNAEAFISPI
ncbi:hypothetical protein CC1G_05703 [Coprinopsis cinerea okayama7|uniref:Uncharacterized protein n=1 Tax=Coprinopsis cinerea (strain Okayama-7 / 130 / ATCC MYA-4618 / FGSC 9003) TaxID=240176 RepID=A8N9X6_COPC7|nr:hypothetical protein CC1G_05703 [Coprinopsis cinerea okayama7\|eukprot:XP_001831632.2 hypothetical protein CC1G_05703 [Coprinopsis cinerea okayama7\